MNDVNPRNRYSFNNSDNKHITWVVQTIDNANNQSDSPTKYLHSIATNLGRIARYATPLAIGYFAGLHDAKTNTFNLENVAKDYAILELVGLIRAPLFMARKYLFKKAIFNSIANKDLYAKIQGDHKKMGKLSNIETIARDKQYVPKKLLRAATIDALIMNLGYTIGRFQENIVDTIQKMN